MKSSAYESFTSRGKCGVDVVVNIISLKFIDFCAQSVFEITDLIADVSV